jgi:cyclic pyranopterin phosphate synthase
MASRNIRAGSKERNARVRSRLSHVEVGRDGAHARMVDVGEKPLTRRSALARASVQFPAGLLAQVTARRGPKGPVEDVARAAGLLAAKRTSELIPMCHTLGLDHLEIRFRPCPGDVLEVSCRAACRGRTGVEMEAMVGAAVAALAVYDMTKGLDHGIRVRDIELVEKRGGRSGTWRNRAIEARAGHGPRAGGRRTPSRRAGRA